MPTSTGRTRFAAAATGLATGLGMGLSVVAVAAPGAAQATPGPTCGSVVTTSTRLSRDLLDCPGSGLVIGADHVTVDLGGHTVDGLGSAAPFGSAGIDNSGGFDDVVVENGIVRDFPDGVVLVGTTANVVRGLRIADNTSGGIFVDGFAAGGSSANRLAGNLVRGNGNDGISLRGTTDNVVRGNVAAGNRGPGVVLQYASGNSLDANLLTGNAGPGVFLYTLADGNGLALNRVVDNELAGVLVSGGSRNRVVANTIRRNAGGIDVASGQRPLGSDGNVLAQNAITGNAGDGISVYGPWEYVGIQYPGAAGTVVRGNEAAGNGDDGIDVRSAATTITGNGADRNVDLGIDAVPGVTDGGGNHAAGNGNPLQCVGVTCS